MRAAIKRLLLRAIPLRIRKRLAIWVNRQPWVGTSERGYWATELLKDFARDDVNEYHKFLWRHHLAYAETYEIGIRFGYENFNETRKMLFAELPERLEQARLGDADSIDSVLEIGCSLGYLLHYMETEIFRSARRLDGIDIDTHAIDEGSRYLQMVGSRVRLHHGDMESLDVAFGNEQFDLVLAAGVLLYLDRASAQALVRKMLERTRKILIITALAHPRVDNAMLEDSEPRTRDGTWIHNVDRMIQQANGTLVARRWEGGKLVDGNTVYFLYAVPTAPA